MSGCMASEGRPPIGLQATAFCTARSGHTTVTRHLQSGTPQGLLFPVPQPMGAEPHPPPGLWATTTRSRWPRMVAGIPSPTSTINPAGLNTDVSRIVLGEEPTVQPLVHHQH